MTRDALEELGCKYREMLVMRTAHESGVGNAAQARERMARLASRFPGALREIDELELVVIRDRIDRIDAALRDDGAVELWMEAMAHFHALARGALWAKRWLSGRKTVDAATAREYEAHAGRLVGAAADALAWTGDLGHVASPPRGRITDLIFARVAGSLGTTVEEARFLVFGAARRAPSSARRPRDAHE